jgi:uncharacterized delta-60 repeat protein
MFHFKLPNAVLGALLASTLVIITSPVQAALPDGRIDTSFGTSGFTRTIIGDNDLILDIAIDSQDRIIAGGFAVIGGAQNFALARYTSSGALDTSFGTSGLTTTTIGTSASINSIALDSQGRIIAGGFAVVGGAGKFAVARYTISGVLDTSFGTSGLTTTTIGTGASINSIALDSQGRIIAVGNTDIGGAQNFALARYTSSGALDTSFGTSGLTTTTIGTSAIINSIVLDSQGRIIAGGGTTFAPLDKFSLARYTSRGVLDTSFGTAGLTTTTIGTSASIFSIALDSQGKIIGGGAAVIGGVQQFALARYTSNGVLDTSFGTSGLTTKIIGTNDAILSIALDSQEKILAGGGVTIGGVGTNFVLARYTSSGALDSSFGTSGLVTTTPDNVSGATRAIAFDSQGRVIAGGLGNGMNRLTNEFALVRYFVSTNLDLAAIAAQAAAQAEAARKAKEQKELMEILALIPSIGELTLSLGETTQSLYSTKCVKGKTTKYVKSGTKCPKGYVKKK